MEIKELLKKPLWQLTGEEFLFLNNTSKEQNSTPVEKYDFSQHYVYGINGIAQLFGCSKATANRIKKSKEIDRAITQIGRKIVVNAELALKIRGTKTGGRK